ncbi:hypothetical protein CSIRO_0774 [Bradyrhizobiaceae bacterium SG-6C]|nr:hypothetical protein CSIRO_0774 [Bradyrhizobiaceae bacterium SG-6C]
MFVFYFPSFDRESLSKKTGPIKRHIRIEGMQKAALLAPSAQSAFATAK